jgi:GrpB-like predicted nucleotidyltransferase (UPF0157 family)
LPDHRARPLLRLGRVSSLGDRLGLPDDVVRLRPYTSVWRWLFHMERIRLWVRLRSQVLDIQHVGSTAIPGMIAKPIIDVLVVVENFERAAGCIHAIEQLGYEYKGENEKLRQYYFVRGHPTTHTLYVVERQSEDLAAKTCFRDTLIHHPEVARAYADLKRRFARRFSTDRQAYQEAKGVFIQRVLQMAGVGERT